MITSKRVFIFFGLAAGAATMGACTTGQAASPPKEPPIAAVTTINSGDDIVLPLDAYLLTAKQREPVNAAVQIIGRDCLKKFGLSWPANPPAVIDEPPRNGRRYAIFKPEEAKSIGYHEPTTATPTANQKAPTADAMNVWAGQGEQTFRGQPVPAGGCAGEALRKIAQGAPEADPGMPQKLQFETFARTKADSRVVRAFAEWNKCMQARGYSYPDPYAAANDLRWQTPKASSTELAVATADVACKAEIKLPGLMLAVETAYQNREAEKHADELAAIKSYLEIQLANAGRLAR